MNVEVEKTGSYMRRLSITVPAAEVEAAFDKVFRKYAKSVDLPGFRRGKVPRRVLEKRFAAVAQDDVTRDLINETLFDAMEEKDIMPVGRPEVDSADLVRGTDFAYTADVEVKPEIVLHKYKGLGAPAVDVTVTEDDLQAELEKLQEQEAQLQPVLIRDVVQDGDVVRVDYAGTIDGTPFAGGTATDAMIEIGAGNYIKGFAEQLVGAKVPSERPITVTFPEDYNEESLAGKEATFHMELKELKAKEKPALDDDFARDLDEENLEALRAKIQTRLQKERQERADGERRQALLKDLRRHNPIELPPSMVDAEAEQMVQNAVMRMQMMMRQKFELPASELATLKADNLEPAKDRVANALLLLEVAEVESITVEAAEVQQELDRRVADMEPEQAERVRSHYSSEENQDGIRDRLFEDKVVNFLLEHSVVVAADSGDLSGTPSEGADA